MREAAKMTRINIFEPLGVMAPGMHIDSVKARELNATRDQTGLTEESRKGG